MSDIPLPVLRRADFEAERRGADVLVVRGLVVQAAIGVHAHEHGGTQRLILDIDAAVDPPRDPMADDVRQVVSYERFVDAAKALAAGPRVVLLEYFAERLAATILVNRRVRALRLQVLKPDIYDECEAVGVAIERALR
jgi:dihydroneopterin aldolase